MKTEIVFTKEDIGCYADGANGHEHLRLRLADLVGKLGHDELAAELNGDMSDDASEEDDAIGILQEHTADGLIWLMDGGDLLLADEKETNF